MSPAAATAAKTVSRSASSKDTSGGTTWIDCATEGQSCSFDGTTTVRYGGGTTFATGTFTGSVACSNAIFGDPLPGSTKKCSYLGTSTQASDVSWIYCASEGQACSFTGTATVRYGAGSTFVAGPFTNGVSCSNMVFGDPVPGSSKGCSYTYASVTATPPIASSPPSQPAPSPWTPCAQEGQACAFSGIASVRYGTSTVFATVIFAGGVLCSNSVFGDPVPGSTKSCSYLPTTVAPPVITAQPQSTVVKSGQSASFSVTATSNASLSYQWSRNGVAIAGATTSTLSIPVTQLADSGAIFKVAVANLVGTTASNSAGLTINAIASTGATPQRLFSDQSLWNARPTKFTLGTATIPTSDYSPYIGGGAYSLVASIASASDPPMTVYPLTGHPAVWVPDAEVDFPSVTVPHWPANTVASTGTDGYCDIIDVPNNKIHSFWQLRLVNGQWQAAQYTWTALDGTGWGTPGQYQQGTRAAGVVSIAGVIRASEVDDGQAMYKHALAMSLTFNGLSASPTNVFPATASDWDAQWVNTGSIPEGARIMLPANFDTSFITNPQLLKVVKTLQSYGAYVVDRNYGTPYFIVVENGSDFELMPNGFDVAMAAQLDKIRAALRPIATVTEWVDATGAVFTPPTNLNMLSMRPGWGSDTLTDLGVFDSWQQAVVFPNNGVLTTQVNMGGTSVPTFRLTTPAPGTRFWVRASATGGASMQLTISKMGSSFDTGVLHDGEEAILTWPSGADSAVSNMRVTSGPHGGGTISGIMIQLPK